ncbi:MAG: hypothetical protein AB8G11_04305 [Saprospiraceae bacterium]
MKKFHYNHQEEVLEPPTRHKIIGGIRFFTNNFADFQKKQNLLAEQSIRFETHEDDGVYCVEW